MERGLRAIVTGAAEAFAAGYQRVAEGYEAKLDKSLTGLGVGENAGRQSVAHPALLIAGR